MDILDSDMMRWVIIPLLIFLARIVDVSLQTIRIIFVSRGRKLLAPILGFFEVVIWLLAISQIMKNVSNVASYLAYGGGFAMGTYVGLLIEEKMAMGILLVRVITRKDATDLSTALRREGYGVTVIPAKEPEGPVSVIYTIVRRANIRHVIELIDEHNPNAFYSIEDVRSVSEEPLPVPMPRVWRSRRVFGRRKGK